MPVFAFRQQKPGRFVRWRRFPVKFTSHSRQTSHMASPPRPRSFDLFIMEEQPGGLQTRAIKEPLWGLLLLCRSDANTYEASFSFFPAFVPPPKRCQLKTEHSAVPLFETGGGGGGFCFFLERFDWCLWF